MHTSIRFVLLLCFLGNLCEAQTRSIASPPQKYESPDKSLIATITSNKLPEATAESIVELCTVGGQILVHKDYSSEDGEHGYGVVQAMWTPDSQYFVYSLTSSGGHQAWHSRVKFFSRKQKKVFGLDETISDAVTNPQFSVAAPDIVTVDLLFKQEKYAVSLSKLRPTK